MNSEVMNEVVMNSSLTGPSNTSGGEDLDSMITHYTNVIMIFIAVPGIAGNALALTVILCTPLRHLPQMYLLALLTFFDTVFLLAVLMQATTLDLQTNLFCQLKNYLLNVSAWLCAWTLVSITVERFIAVYFPFKRMLYCHQGTVRRVIVCLLPTPLLYNVYTFVLIGRIPIIDQDDFVCNVRHEPKWVKPALILYGIDTLLVMILPALLLCLLNSLVVIKLSSNECVKAGHDAAAAGGYQQHKPKTDCGTVHQSLQVDNGGASAMAHSPLRKHVSNNSSSTRRKRELTVLLCVIPAVYVCLNTPSYVFRIRSYLKTVQSYNDQQALAPLGITDSERVLELSFRLLNYLSYALDFIVYAVASSVFRKHTRQVLSSGLSRTQLLRLTRLSSMRAPTPHGSVSDDRQTPSRQLLIRQCKHDDVLIRTESSRSHQAASHQNSSHQSGSHQSQQQLELTTFPIQPPRSPLYRSKTLPPTNNSGCHDK